MFPALSLIIIFTFIGLLSGFVMFLIWNDPSHEDLTTFVLAALVLILSIVFIIGLGKDFRLSYVG